ncbi:unnamed protein product [Prorocentrum cordatum]|uniref:COX assembly mitochondrial protein n=1 Tax=Prorocentrum cordatum TaxID=2364126 RepID=A0ABN9XXQ7_9DINO|nr:unnamed protein product [Polarella glacialis]
MSGQRLPERAMREVLSTGCSKRASHRQLPRFQQFEIPHKFPRFPQVFGDRIVRRVRKKETGNEEDHPCSKHFDSFLVCARRYPQNYDKKCRTEAGKYLACLEENQKWKASEPYQYMRFLEHFRVFSEGSGSWDEGPGKFRYEEQTPKTHGAGSVLQFGRSPGGGGGGKGGGPTKQ